MRVLETKFILLIPAPVLLDDSVTIGSRADLELLRFVSWEDMPPALILGAESAPVYCHCEELRTTVLTLRERASKAHATTGLLQLFWVFLGEYYGTCVKVMV